MTGHQDERVAAALAGLDVRRAHNRDYQSGLASSLKTGVRAVSADAAGRAGLARRHARRHRRRSRPADRRLCEIRWHGDRARHAWRQARQSGDPAARAVSRSGQARRRHRRAAYRRSPRAIRSSTSRSARVRPSTSTRPRRCCLPAACCRIETSCCSPQDSDLSLGSQFDQDPRPTLPPSVLPDISPSRGEIGCHNCLRQSSASQNGAQTSKQPISPLEGEMSGRTEGGDVERKASRNRARNVRRCYGPWRCLVVPLTVVAVPPASNHSRTTSSPIPRCCRPMMAAPMPSSTTARRATSTSATRYRSGASSAPMSRSACEARSRT